jgi:hypothetical protein
MTEPKFKQGDIVDTPYHGRRQILRVWWLGKLSFDEHEGCWMYENQRKFWIGFEAV